MEDNLIFRSEWLFVDMIYIIIQKRSLIYLANATSSVVAPFQFLKELKLDPSEIGLVSDSTLLKGNRLIGYIQDKLKFIFCRVFNNWYMNSNSLNGKIWNDKFGGFQHWILQNYFAFWQCGTCPSWVLYIWEGFCRLSTLPRASHQCRVLVSKRMEWKTCPYQSSP